MTENGRNAMIGLFVLGGLIALAILLIKFGESSAMFSRGYTIAAIFDEVPNIRDGTEVRLAGVPVGRVLRVDLVDRNNPTAGVCVDMEIEHGYPIFKDSVATVSPPIMGQPHINIYPPPRPTEALAPGKQIDGKIVNVLDDIIDPELMDTVTTTTEQIRALAEALTPAAGSLHELLQRRTIEDVERARRTGEPLPPNVYTAVHRLNNVLVHVEDVLGDPNVRSGLKETLANLKTASEDAKAAAAGFRTLSVSANEAAGTAKGVIERVDVTVQNTQGHIDVVAEKLTTNLDKLSELLDHLISAGEDLSSGDGTAGLLLRDNEFYEAMLLTTERLGEAALDLRVLLKQWREKGILSSP